jgi:hypothetical protein
MFAVWAHRHDVAGGEGLELGNDVTCAGAPEVVEDVVAVPAGARDPDLNQPRPDLFRGAEMVIARVALNVGRVTSSSPGSGRDTSPGVAPHVSCQGRRYRA